MRSACNYYYILYILYYVIFIKLRLLILYYYNFYFINSCIRYHNSFIIFKNHLRRIDLLCMHYPCAIISKINNRGVPNILRQPTEAEYSAVWPNILLKPNRGSLFAE